MNETDEVHLARRSHRQTLCFGIPVYQGSIFLFFVKKTHSSIFSLPHYHLSIKRVSHFEHQLSPETSKVTHRNASTLISNALVGYLSSNFSRTVGCRIPKVPMFCSFPAMRTWIDAAWPGK